VYANIQYYNFPGGKATVILTKVMMSLFLSLLIKASVINAKHMLSTRSYIFLYCITHK